MQINFKDVNYTYNINTPYQKKVLNKINLEIKKNSFTTILGKNGSGKSTLIEHINGLLIPDSGYVKVSDLIIEKKKTKKEKNFLEKNLLIKRKNIAVLFQFSEQQIFENTVLKDIIFGPLNYGIPYEDAVKKAEELISIMNLSKEILHKSPFELSGGEMRKIALCGVLALDPKVIILDEPTIGLDLKSKQEFMNLINKIYKNNNVTIILVTHNLEYVEYASDIIVIKNGKIDYNSSNINNFIDYVYENKYLELPDIIKFQKKLIEKGININKIYTNYNKLLKELLTKVGNNNE